VEVAVPTIAALTATAALRAATAKPVALALAEQEPAVFSLLVAVALAASETTLGEAEAVEPSSMVAWRGNVVWRGLMTPEDSAALVQAEAEAEAAMVTPLGMVATVPPVFVLSEPFGDGLTSEKEHPDEHSLPD
jgi:hypothetical protein